MKPSGGPSSRSTTPASAATPMSSAHARLALAGLRPLARRGRAHRCGLARLPRRRRPALRSPLLPAPGRRLPAGRPWRCSSRRRRPRRQSATGLGGSRCWPGLSGPTGGPLARLALTPVTQRAHWARGARRDAAVAVGALAGLVGTEVSERAWQPDLPPDLAGELDRWRWAIAEGRGRAG